MSKTGGKTPFLPNNDDDDEHFLRIPINDCHSEQLLPYLDESYTFIGKHSYLIEQNSFFFGF